MIKPGTSPQKGRGSRLDVRAFREHQVPGLHLVPLLVPVSLELSVECWVLGVEGWELSVED